MEPTEFERFFQLRDSDDTTRPEAEFLVLDKLFGDTVRTRFLPLI